MIGLLRHVMWRSPELEWRVWHVLAWFAWCVLCEWLGEALKRRNNRGDAARRALQSARNRWK